MYDKQQLNAIYSRYFHVMSKDDKLNSKRFQRLSDNIVSCLSLWVWDKYEENKLLDLQRVDRCNYSKWCPNCRKLALANAIHNFSPSFESLLHEGYNPYLLTLTVPSVRGEDLKHTIHLLNKCFRKFFQALSLPVGQGYKGFKNRAIQFDAAIKVIEVTYNSKTNMFHPHIHAMVFSLDYDVNDFDKNVLGLWSSKRDKADKHSFMDFHMMQLWTMCWKGVRLTSKNWEVWSDIKLIGNDYLYICDIKEMNPRGIYEVFKYTFKDTDILNLYVFKTLFNALDGQRLRQGYGLLYNVKIDDNESEGEKQDISDFLEVNKNEVPEQLLTRELEQLIKVYQPYRKISRFRAYEELGNIIE